MNNKPVDYNVVYYTTFSSVDNAILKCSYTQIYVMECIDTLGPWTVGARIRHVSNVSSLSAANVLSKEVWADLRGWKGERESTSILCACSLFHITGFWMWLCDQQCFEVRQV